jgi:general L-amino acid transport system permease protein
MASKAIPTDQQPAKPPFWADPRVRAIAFQILTLGAVVAFGVYIVNNTLHNLASRGISSGFGFLSREAGFGIAMSLIPYTELSSYGRAFFVGLLNTILVAVCGIALATAIGFLMGIARLSHNWLVARLATVYVEIVRNVPLLLQLLFWYQVVLQALPAPKESIGFGESVFLNVRGLFTPKPVFGEGFGMIVIALVVAIVAVVLLARWAKRRRDATGQQFHTVYASVAILLGLPLVVFVAVGMPLTFEYPELGRFRIEGGLGLIPEFVALLVGLSVYTGAFIAEIVRAGILSVSKGQIEAAHALGLRPNPTLRLVIIPQALRVIIPPLTSQYLNLTKNSSLAVAIAYPDLVSVFAGTVLNQTGQAVEAIAMTMAVYLTLSLLISGGMNWYNARMALVER